jgi:hypothetical protein
MTLQLRVRTFVRVSAALIAFLFVAGFALKTFSVLTGRERLFGLMHLFDLNAEQTVSVWYQTMTLFLASALAMLVTVSRKRSGARDTAHWAGLSLVFAAMSVDELVSFHEMIGEEVLAPLLGTEGHFNSAWLALGIPFVIFFGIAYLRFFWALPAAEKKGFALAALAYLSGAVLLEIPENLYSVHHGEQNPVFVSFAAFEELLEMIGVLLLNTALLKRVSGEVKSEDVRVEIDDRD